MPKEEIARMLKASRLYYEDNLSQHEIAQILGVSRPQISRLLSKARQMGYVTITITDPADSCKQLEQEIIRRFGLRDCRIVRLPQEEASTRAILARTVSDYLQEILEPGQVLGVSWGTILCEVAKIFPEKAIRGVDVVQLRGGVSQDMGNCPVNIVQELATKLGGRAHYLPVPTLVDTNALRDSIMADRNVHHAQEMWKQCNVVVYSVGVPGGQSVLVEAGYLTRRRINNMRENGAVGEICSRLYTVEGQIFDPELDERTLGIDLAELANRSCSIAVAGGEAVAPGLLGALRGGFATVLIADEEAAQLLLKLAAGRTPMA